MDLILLVSHGKFVILRIVWRANVLEGKTKFYIFSITISGLDDHHNWHNTRDSRYCYGYDCDIKSINEKFLLLELIKIVGIMLRF